MTNDFLDCLKTRVARRFLAVFLAISLLPLLVMRWLAIRKAEAAIEQQTFTVLRAASDGAEAQLREFLEMLKEQLLLFARDARTARELRSESYTTESSTLLSAWRSADVKEVFLLTAKGRVLASTQVDNLDRDESGAVYFTRGKEGFFAGDVLRDQNTGQPTWIMAAPVTDPVTHHAFGVVAFRIDPEKLSSLTSGRRALSKGADTQSFRLGETGETYLVNHDGLLITESRYISNAVLRLEARTLPVKVALDRGQEITAEYKDYRGINVSGSSVVLKEPPWILITEIDFAQAFAPVGQLRKQIIIATIGLIFLSIAFAWVFTWRVLNPIRLLNESDHALAERNEANAFVTESGLPNDEIGDLVRTRNSRVRAVFDYQKQLEQRTLELQEMISELEHISYAIVHDMRAPLRAMQGFATLIDSEEQQTQEERRAYLRKIKSAAERLDHLIQDVLTYNKTVLRHVAVHPVDLDPLLRAIQETYPNLRDAKAEIRIKGVLPTVLGNEALLTQCFANLLDNAVKFVAIGETARVLIWAENAGDRHWAPPVGPMLIANDDGGRPDVRSRGRYVRVCVQDNGIGIPQEDQRRIFGVFQRVTHNQQGTGVGLAIVRKVVERMGGTVGVESSPGEGSRFWVELQASEFVEKREERLVPDDSESEQNIS